MDKRPTFTEVQDWLIRNIAATLEIEPSAIEVNRPLEEYGIDSLQAFSISGDLQIWLGLELPETLVWDYPTIESLCKYLTTEAFPS